ncbi:MAG: F0F1 ATP synthase subunit delta [Verrucomicrobiales bacterium]|jgi:F-type H+-transporting ATPase subunit delta|nr:F0F1 ATP synthase subunit delta [Verrucomicrobiales bacterium]
MKINRESRNIAKRLFLLCRKDGRVDAAAARLIVSEVAARKPRNYLAILTRLARLVEIDLNERSAVVETAAPLADGGAAVLAALDAEFPDLADRQVVTRPELLGGLKIRVGSRVWDVSVSGRLAELAQQF